MSLRVRTSPNAYMTDTDFGAENVRSKPGTRPFQVRIWVPFGDSPVPGASPARTARRSSLVTSSARSSRPAPVPIQRPRVSDAAEVVVVETARDLAQVVGLGADSELPQRQHPPSRRPHDEAFRYVVRARAAPLVHMCGSGGSIG